MDSGYSIRVFDLIEKSGKHIKAYRKFTEDDIRTIAFAVYAKGKVPSLD